MKIVIADRGAFDHEGEEGPIQYVIIDGIHDIEGRYQEWKLEKITKRVWNIVNELAFHRLARYSLIQIGKDFDEITVYLQHTGQSSDNFGIYCSVYPNSEEGRFYPPLDKPTIYFEIDFYFTDWSRPWSPKEYSEQFRLTSLGFTSQLQKFQFWEETLKGVSDGIGIKYHPSDPGTTLLQLVNELRDFFNAIDSTVTSELLQKKEMNTLVTTFNFPKETETACKQYLVYFGQFLSDLGIEAETEIKRQLNETLFKVTPKNKEESLQKIKDALISFLAAPSAPDFDIQVGQYAQSIAASQWQANVMHFKSQLLLANSVLQAKDQTISAMEMTITALTQQVKLLESEGIMKNLSDSEPVIPGVMSVTTLEGNGFKFYLPEVLRKLKRAFRKES